MIKEEDLKETLEAIGTYMKPHLTKYELGTIDTVRYIMENYDPEEDTLSVLDYKTIRSSLSERGKVEWLPGAIHVAKTCKAAIFHNLCLAFTEMFLERSHGYIIKDLYNIFSQAESQGKEITYTMTGYPNVGISWKV